GAGGHASKNVEPRKTRMRAPVNFSRWFCRDLFGRIHARAAAQNGSMSHSLQRQRRGQNQNTTPEIDESLPLSNWDYFQMHHHQGVSETIGRSDFGPYSRSLHISWPRRPLRVRVLPTAPKVPVRDVYTLLPMLSNTLERRYGTRRRV